MDTDFLGLLAACLSKIIFRNSTALHTNGASFMLLKPQSSKPFLIYRLQLSVEFKTETQFKKSMDRLVVVNVLHIPGFTLFFLALNPEMYYDCVK